MASKLSRLFSSIIDLSSSSPKLTLPYLRSESITNSTSRFISSSSHHRHENEISAAAADSSKSKENIENKEADAEEQEEDDDDDDGGLDLNEENGEIGGPRGPEPTRYGDWERNGRCYDF